MHGFLVFFPFLVFSFPHSLLVTDYMPGTVLIQRHKWDMVISFIETADYWDNLQFSVSITNIIRT